ncbi:MAG: hypothetical protein LC132_02860 [Burkholderiales bacterium]|nr:hypothetical protein [Burkholderiales bacterium]
MMKRVSFWSAAVPSEASSNNAYGYKLSWAPSGVVDSSNVAKIIKTEGHRDA